MKKQAAAPRSVRRRFQKEVRKNGVSVSASRAVKDVSLNVRVTRTKAFDVRLRIGTALMRWGAKVIGYGRFVMEAEPVNEAK